MIASRIPAAGADPRWAVQFEEDLKTFGLFEAILYFHGYPQLRERFVDEACGLYERIAGLYLKHRDEIRSTDDSRVLAQLHLLRRLGDSAEHVTLRPLEPPRRPLDGIAAPARPESSADYERRLPAHADLLDIAAWMAKQPVALSYGCFADELCETLGAKFTFEGFPGVPAAFFEIADVLEEHGVEVFGPEGQYVLAVLIGYLGEEMFGDYERWYPCVDCGDDFFVEISLDSVNASLTAGGWKCEACRGEVAGAGGRG